MNTSFSVKPNLGLTIACRPQLPPSMFFGLNVRSIGIKDPFHGPLLRRKHHSIPFAKSWGEQEPFRLKDLRCTTKEVIRRTPSMLKTYQILGPGMILLEKYVSLKDQANIVNVCDKWGMYPGGFDVRDYRKVMCFGRSWDPKAPPVPYQLISLAATAVEDARAHLDELPSMCPDTCLVTFYRHGAFDDELYQDRDVSGRRLPVVSISINDEVTFSYRLPGDALKSVSLKSGDVLIYGGKSRYIDHGITHNHDTSLYLLFYETQIKPGYLNLTFTQF